MKQFDITYFAGPTTEYVTKPEIIADIAASGMTLMPLNYNTETNKAALPILQRYGLRAIVSDPRIRKIYAEDDLAGAEAAVREVVLDYAAYPNVIGWDIVDEPNAAKFPVLAAIVNAFRKFSPEAETTINLYPNYASAQQLGTPDYITYLETFVNTVRPHLLSYDHYHFVGRAKRKTTEEKGISERERLIRISAETVENRAGFFDNIRDVRACALKYGIDPMLIILLTEHGLYRNLTRGELFWEVNMCLAYGMRRISYFTYWEPSGGKEYWQWENAMCNTVGKKEQHWYDVQAVNAEILDAGRYLFERTSTAVFHIGMPEDGAEAFVPFGGIERIEGENGVIGFFDDGSVYLVNRDFQNKNTFRLYVDRPISVRKNGAFVTSGSEETRNCLTYELGAGEAVLLHLGTSEKS